jgi:hypothetical protein
VAVGDLGLSARQRVWETSSKALPKEGHFLCRHCHDLTYNSQREGKEGRQLSKVVRIYRRLGLTIQDVPFVTPKPKGMHQKTYNRLIERAQGLAYESPETVTRKLDKHAKSTLIGPSSSLSRRCIMTLVKAQTQLHRHL